MPDGRSPDAFQLEELLRRSRTDQSPKPSSPESKAEDVKRLQQVIKELQELGNQLPSDLAPRNLDGISDDLLTKALDDPEVRKMAEKIVEQHQRNKQKQREQSPDPVDKAPTDKTLDQEGENATSAPPLLTPPTSQPSSGPSPSAKPPTDRPKGSPNPSRNPNQKPSSSQNQNSKNKPLTSDSPAPTSPNQRDSKDPLEQDPLEESPENATPNSKSPSSDQTQMMQSMDEFLRQAEELDKKQTKQKSGNSPGPQSSDQSTGDESKNRGGSTEKSKTPADIKKQLNEKGLGSTFDRIIEEARQASQGNSDKKLDKQVDGKDSKSTREPRKSQSTSPTAPNPSKQNEKPARNTTQPNRPPEPSRGTGSNTANAPAEPDKDSWSAWFSKIAQEAFETADAAPSKPEKKGNASESPNSPFQLSLPNGWLILATVAIIVGVVAVILYCRQPKEFKREVHAGAMAHGDYLKQPDLIRSKADVIRAFHQLAYRIAHPLETWSTHRTITSQVGRTTPDIRTPLNVIADVYEQARYLPNDSALSQEQLDSVRRAIQACE